MVFFHSLPYSGTISKTFCIGKASGSINSSPNFSASLQKNVLHSVSQMGVGDTKKATL